VLGAGRRLTMTDMTQLQHDELSLPARSLVPLLRGLQPMAGRVREAAGRLQAWDLVLDRDSVAAAIHVAWEKALRQAVWESVVPKDARQAFPASALSTEKIIAWLTVPDSRFGADPIAGRDALVL